MTSILQTRKTKLPRILSALRLLLLLSALCWWCKFFPLLTFTQEDLSNPHVGTAQPPENLGVTHGNFGTAKAYLTDRNQRDENRPSSIRRRAIRFSVHYALYARCTTRGWVLLQQGTLLYSETHLYNTTATILTCSRVTTTAGRGAEWRDTSKHRDRPTSYITNTPKTNILLLLKNGALSQLNWSTISNSTSARTG